MEKMASYFGIMVIAMLLVCPAAFALTLPTQAVAPVPQIAVAQPTVAPAQPNYPLYSVDVSGRPTLFSTDSRVTIVEFSDFQCPFCRDSQSTMQKIIDAYGTSVNFIHMNYPLPTLHPYAQKASEAVECAGAQGKYWEMHKELFALSSLDTASIMVAAQSIGLDTGAFSKCLSSGSMASTIESQVKIGNSIGISGTPTFIIGSRSGNTVTGQMIVGAVPYADFKKAIESVSPSSNKAPVISGISAPSSLRANEQGTWTISAYDPEGSQLTYTVNWGDGSLIGALYKISSFTHSYSAAGTYTVSINAIDDAGQSASASATVAVGGEVSCTSMPNCEVGYEPVFSNYDSNNCAIYSCQKVCATQPAPICPTGWQSYTYADSDGCTRFGCKNPSSQNAAVDVSISVQPQTVNTYESVGIFGKITYTTDSGSTQDAAYARKKFKVVTSLADYDKVVLKPASTSKKGTVFFESSGSIFDEIIRRITPPQQSQAAAPNTAANEQASEQTSEPQQSVAAAIAPTAVAGSGSGGGGSVAVVAVPTTGTASAQERVDYIVLSPGETTSVSAYFTPSSPGTKLAQVSVYSYDYICPPQTNPPIGMPCRESLQLVGSASAKVNVLGETPPPPPPGEGAEGTLSFSSGWNMVSVPVDAKVSMAVVSQTCGTAAFAWRLTENGYVKEDTLSPGFGYWVKGTQGCTYTVKGNSATGSIAPLFQGWNLVGSLGREVQLSDMGGTCSVSSGPWHYRADQRQYEYSSSLLPGNAYWIKVAASCSLGFGADDSPPAPPQ